MKKLIYILIAVFTFSVGFWLYHLRPLIMPVSLCEISERDAKFFESKKIRVKAFLDSAGTADIDLGWSVFDYRNGCLKGAALMISPEKIKEQLKNDENLNASVNLIRQKQQEEFDNRRNPSYTAVHYFAEVEITGEIQDVDSVEPLPIIIKVDEIKQISSIHSISYEEIQEIRNKANGLK